MELQNYKSVVAQNHGGNTTERFAFIPTTRVIDLLQTQGWEPNKISEKAVRKESYRGFQTHLIRFRRIEDNINVNSLVTHANHIVRRQDPLTMFPEIILKNAHDGTAAFQIMAGIFRLVCSNGLIIADSMFQTHTIRHLGFQDQNVIDAVYDVMETTPKIMGRVDDFKQIELDRPEQIAFAEAALLAKYGEGDEKLKKFDPEFLTYPRRNDDRMGYGITRNTLWNTFNVVQEKLVETGGKFAIGKRGQMAKARGVKSVSENIRINQALWALTEKMAELKGAAKA
jgi:hypothetical protein